MENVQPTRMPAWKAFANLIEDLLARIFQPQDNRLSQAVTWLGLAVLFLYGVRAWGVFFSWGDFSLDFADWAEVFGPRFAMLQDAAKNMQLPLHGADMTAMRGVTDRYLAIADTPVSPQYLLLRFLDLSSFMFWNTLLLYAAGFVGLLLIYRKYRLSLWSFSLLFFLFFFNGHITGHLGVGHMNWLGYFLQPFFIYLLFGLVERQQVSWKWILGMALTLLAILLQGHLHLFVWCLIFLVLLALFNPRLLKPVALAGFFSVLVSLPRLLPPVLVLNDITQEPLGGFATWTDLLGSLVVLRDPDRAFAIIPSYIFPLKWWEQDHFISIFGAALLLVFGILLPLRADRRKQGLPLQLLIPSLILAAFSVGRLFNELTDLLPVPPFTGERVTSRFLALPMLIVLTLAVITIDRWVKARRFESWQLVLLLGVTGMLVNDLEQHASAWRVRYLDGLTYLFPKQPFEAARHVLSNHADPVYTNLMVSGGVIALAALGFLIFRAVREPRS
jgi:multisubunit Na+/H+ antiporter MnhC subunit